MTKNKTYISYQILYRLVYFIALKHGGWKINLLGNLILTTDEMLSTVQKLPRSPMNTFRRTQQSLFLTWYDKIHPP